MDENEMPDVNVFQIRTLVIDHVVFNLLILLVIFRTSASSTVYFNMYYFQIMLQGLRKTYFTFFRMFSQFSIDGDRLSLESLSTNT